MKYTASSFMVAPSGSYEHAHAVCHNSGHMQPDVRGKCMRCGEPAGLHNECHIPFITTEAHAFQSVVMNRRDLGRKR